jgi:hypothetical protein
MFDHVYLHVSIYICIHVCVLVCAHVYVCTFQHSYMRPSGTHFTTYIHVYKYRHYRTPTVLSSCHFVSICTFLHRYRHTFTYIHINMCTYISSISTHTAVSLNRHPNSSPACPREQLLDKTNTLYTHIQICGYTHTPVHIYLYTYTCTHISVHAYLYTHTCIYTRFSRYISRTCIQQRKHYTQTVTGSAVQDATRNWS